MILKIILNITFVIVLIMDFIVNHKISKRLDDIEKILEVHGYINRQLNMRVLGTIKRVTKLEERMKDEDSISM